MRLCFDATRFGFGLKEAVGMAAMRQIPAFAYTFEPFPVAGKEARSLADSEKKFLAEVKKLCLENAVEIACLNLNYCLNPADKASVKHFKSMVSKISRVARALGCQRLSFWMEPASNGDWLEHVEGALSGPLEQAAENDVKLLLRLSSPPSYRGKSLALWAMMDPQSWRDVLGSVPGLSLSFSPADCLWLRIDYLRILPAFVPAIEHIEANDIEINQAMLEDSGLFGPLWWRYRLPGQGRLDWPQLVEALKLYGYEGDISVQLDDEFVGSSLRELDDALASSLEFVGRLVRG